MEYGKVTCGIRRDGGVKLGSGAPSGLLTSFKSGSDGHAGHTQWNLLSASPDELPVSKQVDVVHVEKTARCRGEIAT